MIRREGSTTVLLRTLEPQRATRRLTPRPRRLDRRAAVSRRGRAIGVVLTLFIAAFGFLFSAGAVPGTSPAPANAAFWDGITQALCFYGDANQYEAQPEPWPGVVGFLGGAVRAGAGAAGNAATGNFEEATKNVTDPWFTVYGKDYAPTAYEWWGTAGLEWENERYDSLGAECIPFSIFAGSLVANVVQFISLAVGEIGLTIFGWANSINAVDPFLDAINQVVGTLGDALFFEYLIPIVMLGALWVGWQGLVKKRSSEAMQGIVWMVLAAGASAFFIANPAYITAKINSVVVTVQAQITGAAISLASGTDIELCTLPEGTDIDQQYRVAQCQIWESFMYAPWAAGMFGPLAGTDIQIDQEQLASGVQNVADQNIGVGEMAVSIPGREKTNNLMLTYLDSGAWNHNQVLELWFLPGVTNTDEAAIQRATAVKTGQWHAVYDTLNENPAAIPAKPYFTGNDWSGRLGVAFVNIIAMSVGAIPMMFLSFTLIIMQLGFVLTMLAAPLFLTLGIHPGFGRKVAIGWLELIVSLSIKRIATSVLLAVLLAAFMAVTRSTDSWIAKSILIGAVSLALLGYRKRLLDQVSRVNFGGDGGGGMQGAGQQMAGQAKSKAMRGTTAAMGRGGSSGGIGASLAAGLVGGAVGQTFGRRIATRSAMKQRQQAAQERAQQREQERAADTARRSAGDESWERAKEAYARDRYENDPVARARIDDLAKERWRERLENEDDAMTAAAERINTGRSTVDEEVDRIKRAARTAQERGDVNWNMVSDRVNGNTDLANALAREGFEQRPVASNWTQPGVLGNVPDPDPGDVARAQREYIERYLKDNPDEARKRREKAYADSQPQPQGGPQRPY